MVVRVEFKGFEYHIEISPQGALWVKKGPIDGAPSAFADNRNLPGAYVPFQTPDVYQTDDGAQLCIDAELSPGGNIRSQRTSDGATWGMQDFG